VVEGKIGWWRFLVLYCLIGVVYGALVQVGMYMLMDDYQVVLGASAVIFGLIGLAVVWAPRNDINVLIWFIVPRTFEIPILMLGFAYFALHLVSLAATRFQLSSELLHMVGLGIGLPLGVFLLKREWVDCEGWDLMAVLAGNAGSENVQAVAQRLAERQQHDEDRQDRQRATIVRSFSDALAAANLPVAQAIFRKNQTLFSAQHPWPAGLLKQLIRALHDAKEWEASVPAMCCLIDQSAEPMTAVRLRLAQIQLQVCRRPHQCLQLLASLPENLAPQQAELRRRLNQAAQRDIAEGRSELEFDDGD
jgi:hypothetical protein